MLERDIATAIKRYLASLGSDVFFWKEHGGPYGCAGIPDIICCYKGRFLGLECKLPGGRLTELQKRAIEKINRAGLDKKIRQEQQNIALRLAAVKQGTDAEYTLKVEQCDLSPAAR